MYHAHSTPEQKAAKAQKRLDKAAAALALIQANPTPASFPSQAARLAWYRAKLLASPKWALKTLAMIYARQTSDEQAAGATVVWNGAGFGAFDAEILTDMAKRVETWKAQTTHQYPEPLSAKQMALMQSIISKYAGQLIESLGDKAIPVVHVSKKAAADTVSMVSA